MNYVPYLGNDFIKNPWNHRSCHLTFSPETPPNPSLSTFHSKRLLLLGACRAMFFRPFSILLLVKPHFSSKQRTLEQSFWDFHKGQLEGLKFAGLVVMGALAPVSPWMPEDDLLLKNAVEVNFIRNYLCLLYRSFVNCFFNFSALFKYWGCLLWDCSFTLFFLEKYFFSKKF